MSEASRLDGGVLIPDLLRSAPQVRPVLDRYGLSGCGGEAGPAESLAFFARMHEVPLEALLRDLRAAAEGGPAAGECCPRCAADSAKGHAGGAVYRPFFRAGIAVALSAGAVWGAYLLLKIAFQGTFTAAGLHEVNAHGHAQVFGWVGLFVMGFAYQAFPRFKQAALHRPGLAHLSLWLMLAGLVGRSLGEPLASALPGAGALAVAASVLEVSAIALFAWLIAMTWRHSGKGLAASDYYILGALFWFVVQAVLDSVYLAATLSAAGRAELLSLVATWQPALREVQIHGFALLMILGVSQRLLPNLYGLREPNRRVSLAALACLNLAVLGGAAGTVLMRKLGHPWVALWYGSAVLLAGAVGTLLWDWRVFGRARESDRSLKFVRAAYAWLLLSLALLVLLPAYQLGALAHWAPESESARLRFSHAYYGAVRHAITVGFVSLMIVGVAARVVPTLTGADVRRLSKLWAPFALINVGCAWRVVTQIATDFTPGAFPVAGVSGCLEVLGLALWGAHLWHLMAGRGPAARPAGRDPNLAVTADDRVGELLESDPGLLAVFLSFGFQPLASPWLRRTLAHQVSIRTACRQAGVEVERLVAALNAGRDRRRQRRHALPLAGQH
jgi:hypothetical protein